MYKINPSKFDVFVWSCLILKFWSREVLGQNERPILELSTWYVCWKASVSCWIPHDKPFQNGTSTDCMIPTFRGFNLYFGSSTQASYCKKNPLKWETIRGRRSLWGSSCCENLAGFSRSTIRPRFANLLATVASTSSLGPIWRTQTHQDTSIIATKG